MYDDPSIRKTWSPFFKRRAGAAFLVDSFIGRASVLPPRLNTPGAASPPGLTAAPAAVVDLAAAKQVVQPADPVPAIPVAFDHHAMAAAVVGTAVILGQEVDQQLAVLRLDPDGETDLARLGVEVVHEQNRVVAPVVAQDQDRRIARRDDGEIAPADFRHLLAHADDALGPVEQRIGVAALDRRVDVLEAVGPVADHRHGRLVALGEAAIRLIRPLHGRAGAMALWQAE